MEMDVSTCTVWVSPTAGLLHPVAVPGSQSPLFLELGPVSPQSCSFIPAAGTDALTHTCPGTHTEHTPWAGLSHTAREEAALGCHCPLPCSTHRDTHTHQCPRTPESPSSRKRVRERFSKRTGHISLMGCRAQLCLPAPVHT